MAQFEIGQRVVCVDDSRTPHKSWHGFPVVKGEIYTIRENCVSVIFHDINCVRLEEITGRNMDWPYKETRFEPLQKTSIEIFNQMLVSKELEDVK